jgi:predicted DNA-binding transcriptional regulator AlpA/DNA-binding helix-hairpin-helix protein with protein kinase domain
LVINQDTSVTADVAMLDRLDKASQEIAVTRMLDQSKQWLDRAMEATNPAREVAEFKAFVATVSEASKQKKLSEGIQLDSTEMVRRAERALGVAIRKGQEAGEIADKGQRNVYAGPSPIDKIADSALSSPTEFARKDELTNSNGGIYDRMDDGELPRRLDLGGTRAKWRIPASDLQRFIDSRTVEMKEVV